MSEDISPEVAVLALSAATEYVELFCRRAGVTHVVFAEGGVEVVGATCETRGRTLEEALRRLYRLEARA